MRSETLSFSSLTLLFDGSDYPHWKFKIELYFDSDRIRLWDVILDGWEALKAKVDNVEFTINRSQWT